MKYKIFIILSVCSIFFISGCGSSSSNDIIPTPTPSGYEVNGNIIDISTGINISNSQFYLDNNTSFLSDAIGDFTFFYNITGNNYISFYRTDGLRMNLFVDTLTSSNNNYKIFIDNTKSLFVNQNMNSDEYNKIRILLDYYLDEDFLTLETEADSYILESALSNDYKKFLYILRDFAIISQDFSRISEINTTLYYSSTLSSQNYMSAREIYGGILYCIKTLLYTKDSYGIQNSIDFLERLRLDELNLTNNTTKIFNFMSDDLKALLLLGYIYTEDNTGIEIFRNFTPQDTGSFFL